jgi:hypothetical protein
MNNYREIQHLRYQKWLEIEKAKENIIEQIDEEQLRIKSIENEELFHINICFSKLENILIDISNSKNIIQLDMYISSFKNIIDNNITLFIIKDKLDITQSLIIKMIDIITHNNFSYQYSNLSKYEKMAIIKFESKIKDLLTIAHMDPSIIDIQTMDTSNDEQIALQLIDSFDNFYI